MNIQILYKYACSKLSTCNSVFFLITTNIFQETLSTLFSLYIRDTGTGDGSADAGWLGRQGVALALHSAADVLRTKDLPVVMTFLISRALVIFTGIFENFHYIFQTETYFHTKLVTFGAC